MAATATASVASTVDEAQPAPLSQNPVHRCLPIRLQRHIQANGNGVFAACLNGLRNRSRPLLVDVRCHGLRTLSCHPPRYCRADPGGGPGDKGLLFGQLSVPHPFHPRTRLLVYLRKVHSGHGGFPGDNHDRTTYPQPVPPTFPLPDHVACCKRVQLYARGL